MKPEIEPPKKPPSRVSTSRIIDLDDARRRRRAAASMPTPPSVLQSRTRQNVIALLLVGLLVTAGAWLIVQLRDSLRTELCIEVGRRDCALQQVPK